MTVEVTFEYREIQEYLAGVSEKAESIRRRSRPFLDAFSPIIMRDLAAHFDSESGPDGLWAPWSRRYRRFMESIGKGGNKILQDTGRLRRGIRIKPDTEGIVLYNDVVYAGVHQQGGRRIPARPYLWLSDGAEEALAELALSYLES